MLAARSSSWRWFWKTSPSGPLSPETPHKVTSFTTRAEDLLVIVRRPEPHVPGEAPAILDGAEAVSLRLVEHSPWDRIR